MTRAYNCESFFCICSSYNSGVSFSRTQKPFLWNGIIQKHRASVSQGPGEDSLTSISHQLKDTGASVGIYTDRPSVIFQFPDCSSLCHSPSLTPSLFFKMPVTSKQIQVEFSSSWTLFPTAAVYYWLLSVLNISASGFVSLGYHTVQENRTSPPLLLVCTPERFGSG